jgi:peptidoglycan/LPS O-acetylase OafA/YrhL
VDIFLVISGYLLFLSFTRQGNKLDIKEFAKKKLFRIFPPMIVLVLLVLTAGLYFLDYSDLVTSSRASRYTLLCNVNNFLARTQNDYFAADAIENPFLHMWYLSVTVQIYLMFAIGCIVYRFIPKKLSMGILWGAGIISFCVGYSYQMHNILLNLGFPVWEQPLPVSHYLTLPRVWEPLAGGVILLLPAANSKMRASLLTLLGLAAAIIPSLSPSALADYGVPAVVLGTMLIIRYMPASVFMPVLSNKLLTWIGGISFSLYLVHMPIIAFYHTTCEGLSSWGDYAFVLALSFALAWLFWFLVEKRKVNLYLALGLWITGLLLSIAGKSTNGFKDYLYPESNSIGIPTYNDWEFCAPEVLSTERDSKELRYSSGIMILTNTTKRQPKPSTPVMQMGPASATPSLLLIGDSHAQAAYLGLNRLCHELNHPGAYLSSIILPFWDREFYINESYYLNKAKGEAIMRWIEANPCITHVMIAQYWRIRENKVYQHWDLSSEPMTLDLYYKSLREFVMRIHNMGRHVIILNPGPEIPSKKPDRYIRLAVRKGITDIDLAPLTCTRQYLEEQNKNILPLTEKLQAEGLCSVLDTLSFIPEDKPYVVYKDGKMLMKDSNHLSGEGSTELFFYLRPQIEKLLKQRMPANSNTP